MPSLSAEIPALVPGELSSTDTRDERDTPTQEMLYQAFNIDPSAPCELQRPDVNFFEELVKLPVDFLQTPLGTDVEGMRHWIEKTLLNGPLVEHRNKCKVKRRRDAIPVDIRDISIPCSNSDGDGNFGIRVYEPQIEAQEQTPQTRPAILMFHGGGWIHGDPRGDEYLSMLFASELRAVVFGVDYRLAPEHPFPAPLDDCSQALDWVFQNASAYNIDVNRVGLWGCSAGGNLAAALGLRESQDGRNSQHPQLRFISLVVPVSAAPRAQALYESRRELALSPNEELFKDAPPPLAKVVEEFDKLIKLYTNEKTDECDPFVSPLLSRPSAKHARTHITVAACDDLRAQGLAYGQLLRSCGVSVTEEILPGVPHGFTFPLDAIVTKLWMQGQVDKFQVAFEGNLK